MVAEVKVVVVKKMEEMMVEVEVVEEKVGIVNEAEKKVLEVMEIEVEGKVAM